MDYPDFMLSAGGLNATVEDMARWDRALREHVVLSMTGLVEPWKPVTLADAALARLDERRVVGESSKAAAWETGSGGCDDAVVFLIRWKRARSPGGCEWLKSLQ